MQHVNHLGQPISFPVPDWTPPPVPARVVLDGRFCRLEPLDVVRHTEELFETDRPDIAGAGWTYMPYGPFPTLIDLQNWATGAVHEPGRIFFAIVDKRDNRAHGVACYHRIDVTTGSIEVGFVHFSPALRRSRVATEAMFLMMQNIFEQGYRRYEWKCDALHAGSRAAAQRLGFSYEGVFRQATMYKGRNRDTAWYAVVDADWPALREAFLRWLDPDNFDESGRQRTRLSELTRPLLHAIG